MICNNTQGGDYRDLLTVTRVPELMIIKKLKIAIFVGIFSIILSLFSVYKFVNNKKVISLYNSFTETFSKISVENLAMGMFSDKKGKSSDEEEAKKISGKDTVKTDDNTGNDNVGAKSGKVGKASRKKNN